MEDEKWIQNIRNRMDDYSEPLPPDMWRKLEKDLNVPKVIPLWKRWQFVGCGSDDSCCLFGRCMVLDFTYG